MVFDAGGNTRVSDGFSVLKEPVVGCARQICLLCWYGGSVREAVEPGGSEPEGALGAAGDGGGTDGQSGRE